MRLVHYNVKRLCALDAVCRTLVALRPDVVTLNEVDVAKNPRVLYDLANTLGLDSVHFFGHVRGSFGNAVLSRAPAELVDEVHLDGGSVVSHAGQPYRIARGLLVCRIGDIILGCTHLDHMCEVQRRTQMQHVADAMEQYRGGAAELLLAGDFNALTRRDYTDAAWAALHARNARNGWGSPVDSAAPDGAIAALFGRGYGDAALLAPGAPRAFTSPAVDPCQRIDYLFSGGAAVNVLGVQVDSAAPGSDHLPLVFDIDS